MYSPWGGPGAQPRRTGMRTSPPACRRGSTQSCRRSSARPVHVGDPRSGAVNHQAPEPMGRQPCSRVSASPAISRLGLPPSLPAARPPNRRGGPPPGTPCTCGSTPAADRSLGRSRQRGPSPARSGSRCAGGRSARPPPRGSETGAPGSQTGTGAPRWQT
eukprot:1183824-Prorocentrum_minimum.AAC.1